MGISNEFYIVHVFLAAKGVETFQNIFSCSTYHSLSYITLLLGIVVVVVVWSSLMGDHLNNAHATTDGIKVENQLERRHVQSAFGTS